jgi:Family of unknown function (DUF6455)
MPAARKTEASYVLEMMRRLGLDPAEGVVPHFSLSYLTAMHRCAACVSKRACREWLKRTPGAVSVPPGFCPNADIFLALQFDHLGRARAGMSFTPADCDHNDNKTT